MGQRVLHLYLASWKDSWRQMSEEERNALMEKVHESIDANGGRIVVGAYCAWSTAEYEFFGVEEYPHVEALSTHIATQREIGFSQHVDEKIVVGTPWEPED